MAKKYVTTTTITDDFDVIVETQVAAGLDVRIVPNASGAVDDSALSTALIAQKVIQLSP